MKKNVFNKIRDEYYKKNVIVSTYDDKKIIGKYDSEIKNLGIIYVGNAEVLIKNIKEIEHFKDNQVYKYVVVTYEDDEVGNEYSYRTTINDIKIGDIVVVDRQGYEVTAEVVDVSFYTRDSAPFPVDKTKEIISIISRDDEDLSDYFAKNRVDSENYKYTYNEIEKEIIEKLTNLGLNYKKSLRIILMLRTNCASDRQCEKMLNFLEDFTKQDNLIELEKYARLLANEENWYNNSHRCPACDNGYTSIIDCLENSDEDLWDNTIDLEFEDNCKNCKWHNPIVENEGEDNGPIPFIKLTEEQLKKLNYEEIIAITAAEGGAMGYPGKVEIVVFADDKLIGYETNPFVDGLSYYELYKVIPWLKKFQFGISSVSNVGKGWRHIDTGFGNHLMVREFLDDDLREKLKDKNPCEVYNLWKTLVVELCSIKNYAKEVTFMKNKMANESIYEFIERNITSTGDLPNDFSLKYFKHVEDGDLAFADGMIDYLIESNVDNDILDRLKKLTELLEKDTVVLNGNLVDSYYENNNDKHILGTIDIFLDWIRENSVNYDNKLIFEWGLYMALCGKEIETVKIGISLLGLFNLKEDDNITEPIKNLALSDEFTLYCDIALSNLKNINEIRFDLIKKLHSYGKFILIPKLVVSSKEKKKWLFRYGCINDIDNGWLSIDIATKLDLPKIVKETDLTEDDILGLFNIVEGLMNDEPKQGISVYKDKEKLFEAILSKKEKLCQNIKYLNILCMIKNYLELSQKDSVYISDIQNILNSSETKEVVKSNIEFFKLIGDIIYISSNIQDFDIYNEVYDIFKKSLMNGREDEAIYLINYLLRNNKDSIQDILTLLQFYLVKFDNIGDPEPIINFEDNSLVFIIQELENYPLEGIDFIIKGLMCKSMHPRNASINVIKKWMQLQDNCAKDYLPLNLYNALLELKNKEVIKSYKEGINQILGIKEDLSNYNQPKVRYYQKERMTNQDRMINEEKINLFNGDIDTMFSTNIIFRGKEYYRDKMVFNVIKKDGFYLGYVQGSNPINEYKVSIRIDKNDNILSMNCTCPYESNCKHEYATILYIRNND